MSHRDQRKKRQLRAFASGVKPPFWRKACSSMTESPFVRLAARTSAGSWKSNEDAFLLSFLDTSAAFGCDDAPVSIANPATIAFGVYDGRGMYNDGDGATVSRVAAQEVHASLVASKARGAQLGVSLVTALVAANDALLRKNQADSRYLGCDSLATVTAFDRTSLFVAHVGDGCALLLRRTGWCLLSRSQTLQRLARDGGFDDADELPPKALTASLGALPQIAAVTSVVPLRRGDRLLLCTGWLRQTLGLRFLVSTLRSELHPAAICEALLRAGAEVPSSRNMTVAVLDFLWNDWPEPSAEDPAPLLVETSTGWFHQEAPSQ